MTGMKRVFAGATGLIGRELVKRSLASNYECIVISRSQRTVNKAFGAQVEAVTWEEFRDRSSVILDNAEAVINLAGTNIGKTWWTNRIKDDIVSSRVDSTSCISQALAEMRRPPRLLNASAIGVYGLQETLKDGALPYPLTEASDVSGEGPDFLAKVGRAWENATDPAREAKVPVTNLRFGVVLSPNDGALPLIALQVKMFVGGRIGSGNQPFSWVSIDDVANAVEFILKNPEDTNGPINIVAPGAVSQGEFVRALGRTLRRPVFLQTPAFVFRTLMGQMGDELLVRGQHVYPEKLEKLGYKFEHPDIDTALKSLLT